DACNGHDDTIDEDKDNIPDGCDSFIGQETESNTNSVMMEAGLAFAAILLFILLTMLALSYSKKDDSSSALSNFSLKSLRNRK
ncbi:MAG: hypothetical protein QF454_04210, partial [Candidatus Thalassarchaeaceae archaeon]|nr:hypothetical protein [Candidatus Thalassarchaeaceae archaeon]